MQEEDAAEGRLGQMGERGSDTETVSSAGDPAGQWRAGGSRVGVERRRRSYNKTL